MLSAAKPLRTASPTALIGIPQPRGRNARCVTDRGMPRRQSGATTGDRVNVAGGHAQSPWALPPS